jgi:hypothetical protein
VREPARAARRSLSHLVGDIAEEIDEEVFLAVLAGG